MAQQLSIRTHLEIWQRYGGYLSGLTSLGAELKNVPFSTIRQAMEAQGYFGGWAVEACERAYLAGQRSRS